MAYRKTMQRINIVQKRRVEVLLKSDRVDDYHKSLLKSIKGNNYKNVSPVDNDLLVDLFRRYESID